MAIFINNFNNTIAAIATASGQASISTIRVSGPEAFNITDKIFKSISNKKLINSSGYRAYYGHIIDKSGEQIDEAVVLVFRGPQSYTGEDVVEISCHGGIFVTKKTLSLLLANGAEIATKGEFTKRAFLNGKMSLSEAESVINIIKANNELSSRAAMTSKNGKLDKEILKISNLITDIIAKINARADYPDDDTIPTLSIKDLKSYINNSILALQRLLSSFDSGKILQEGVNTVIVGQPNVGKSTLMNLLTEEETSIVTDIPGTTRDVIVEKVSIDNIIFNISDTAGLRETLDDIEKIGIKRAKEKLLSADLILFIIDSSKDFDDKNYKFIKSINNTAPCVVVINKCDLSRFGNNKFDNKFKNFVEISAKTGQGIKDLKNKMIQVTHCDNIDPSAATLFTERQRDAVSHALSCLEEAKGQTDSGYCLDAIAVVLEDALRYLLQLTGANVNSAVLDSIFSQFCVGK